MDFITYEAQNIDARFYGAFIVSPECWSQFKSYLDRQDNTIRYLYVEHRQGSRGKHFHVLVNNITVRSKDDWEKFYDRVYSQLRRSRKQMGLVPYSKEDFHGRLYSTGFARWLRYVKWEEAEAGEPIELGGWVTPQLRTVWDGITPEDAAQGKDQSNEKKREFVKEIERERRAADIEWIWTLLAENNIRQTGDLVQLNKKDYFTLLTIPAYEMLAQQILDRMNQEKVEFERRSMKREEDWTWETVSLYNFFKNKSWTEEDKAFIEGADVDYYKPGIELLDLILKKNAIDPVGFMAAVDMVIDAHEDKKNTLCLVGASDAGKSTYGKLICAELTKACIGQAGNASHFIFQDVPGKRIVQFEECIVNPAIVDDMKNLCEGSTGWSVNVKNKRNQLITRRIPVVTTSNREPWMQWTPDESTTFENRCVIIRMDAPLTKKDIYSITAKYPNHLQNSGRIHLNYLHLQAYKFWLKMGQNDEAVKDAARMYHRLINYNWGIKYYLNMEYDTFVDVMNTPTAQETEEEAQKEVEDVDLTCWEETLSVPTPDSTPESPTCRKFFCFNLQCPEHQHLAKDLCDYPEPGESLGDALAATII